MTDGQDELLSVRDAAKQCGRNPETVRRWIWSGTLHAEKLGNQLFIKKSDLIPFCQDAIGLRPRPGSVPVTPPRAGGARALREGRGDPPVQPARHGAGSRDPIIQDLRKLRQEVRSLVGELESDDTRG